MEDAGATPRDSTATALLRAAPVLELLAIVLLVALYLASFELESAVNQREVFAHDSSHILASLIAEDPHYPWNPQNHILYHVLVDSGYAVWRNLAGHGPESVFRFLKLFAALTGVGFLFGLRFLLRELGLGPARRTIMIALTGLSVSAWFYYSGFETHGLAICFLTVYLTAVARLCRRGERTRADRVLLAGSLALCVWARVELWLLLPATLALCMLPALRHVRRSACEDVGIALFAGVVGTVCLSSAYLDVSLRQTPSEVIERWDRPSLQVQDWGNLRPRFLIRTARAFSVYPILTPVVQDPVPTTHPYEEIQVETPEESIYWCYFCTPLSTSFGHPLSLLAVSGVLVLLLHGVYRSARLVREGDSFQLFLALAWLGGWLFYTWFNPREPFLWVGELLLPIVVTVANTHARSTPRTWLLMLALAALVGFHNLRFFYWGPAS